MLTKFFVFFSVRRLIDWIVGMQALWRGWIPRTMTSHYIYICIRKIRYPRTWNKRWKRRRERLWPTMMFFFFRLSLSIQFDSLYAAQTLHFSFDLFFSLTHLMRVCVWASVSHFDPMNLLLLLTMWSLDASYSYIHVYYICNVTGVSPHLSHIITIIIKTMI